MLNIRTLTRVQLKIRSFPLSNTPRLDLGKIELGSCPLAMHSGTKTMTDFFKGFEQLLELAKTLEEKAEKG